MAEPAHQAGVVRYYETHPINEAQILEHLRRRGVPLDGLTEDELKEHDQDHYGGIAAVDALATAADIAATDHVLDICSGMGGPARHLAHRLGCRVTGIDLTRSRVESARRLTALVGLADRVGFVHGSALALPFADASFDVVIGQEAWVHVPDKPRLIGEAVRVLRPGGRIAFTDILQHGPMPEATRARLEQGMTYASYGSLALYPRWLEAQGCRVLRVEDLSVAWTAILQGRLTMYRSLRDTTEASFGAGRAAEWDEIYAFFVAQYEAGVLGGGRFLAVKA
jgi:sarcosine/dimethylglycine N-methyltransferase